LNYPEGCSFNCYLQCYHDHFIWGWCCKCYYCYN